MTGTRVRPAASDDLAALGCIAEAAGMFPAAILPDMAAAGLAGEDGSVWLTAERGGEAVGFCYLAAEAFTEGTWNMLALGIDPDRHRTGAGRALVAEAERRLREAGARLLIVDTSGTDAFKDACAFYAAQGYEAEARIRDYWAEGDDKVTFRKALH